jgi:hypothetical protein
MGDHELVAAGELGHGPGGHGDIAPLGVGVSRPSTMQQGIATQRHDDPHPATGSRSDEPSHYLECARAPGCGEDRSSTS